MFTGIIEELGKIVSISNKADLKQIKVDTNVVYEDAVIGDSIAVNGVCLTITKIDKKILSFDVMNETVKKTDLASLTNGSYVNLERALKVGAKISGHYVYGHIDGMRKIINLSNLPGKSYLDIAVNKDDLKYIVEKGSISISGISLTIAELHDTYITIVLIPHTIENTILRYKKKEDSVNVEFDMLAKLVDKQKNASKGITMDFLRGAGY